MNLLRTRRISPLPVTSESLEPFRVMQNMLRWDPFKDLNLAGEGENAFMPSFDVKETADGYIFAADMPGIHTEDLDVQLTGNRLTISGRREPEAIKSNERLYSQERSFGTFNRTFSLPEEIDSGNVSAELRDGVFHLMVPKSSEVRSQRIAINQER